MYRLTDKELDDYREATQEFALSDMLPTIIGKSIFISPAVQTETGEVEPDLDHVQGLTSDISIVSMVHTMRMAEDYAYKQSEGEDEEEIIKYLHNKYTNLIVNNLIDYGVVFTRRAINEIVNIAILELPYLYLSVFEDEDEGLSFLDYKLEAYENYVNSNFSKEGGDEGDEEE